MWSACLEYPDAPDSPVLDRVSVLDRERVELVLSTDPNAQEVSLYEFQRWDPLDGSWSRSFRAIRQVLDFGNPVDGERNTNNFPIASSLSHSMVARQRLPNLKKP